MANAKMMSEIDDVKIRLENLQERIDRAFQRIVELEASVDALKWRIGYLEERRTL